MSGRDEFPAELVERVALGIARFRTSPPEYATVNGGDRKLALAALRALRDIGALVGPDQVAVPRKLLTEAHACMRECGWHMAWDMKPHGDGVLEAAATEIETQVAALLAAAPQPGGGRAMQDDVIRRALEVAVEGYDASRVASHGGTLERDGMSERNKEAIAPMIAAAIAAFHRAVSEHPSTIRYDAAVHRLMAAAIARAAGGGDE